MCRTTQARWVEVLVHRSIRQQVAARCHHESQECGDRSDSDSAFPGRAIGDESCNADRSRGRLRLGAWPLPVIRSFSGRAIGSTAGLSLISSIGSYCQKISPMPSSVARSHTIARAARHQSLDCWKEISACAGRIRRYIRLAASLRRARRIRARRRLAVGRVRVCPPDSALHPDPQPG
jgi:hypothetical protein